MLRFVRDRSLDRLLDALLARMQTQPLPPPAREWVVVQGGGLERWMAQAAALRGGAWGLVETLFPRPFLVRAMAAVLDGGASAAGPHRGGAADGAGFRAALHMEAMAADPAWAALRRAVEGAGGAQPGSVALREALLSAGPSVADALERVAQYRPAWIQEWEAGRHAGPGEAAGWMAEVWRRGVRTGDAATLATNRAAFLEACRAGRRGALPARVSVFGAATLSPAFLEALVALGKATEVDVYLPSPLPNGGRAHAQAAAWGQESVEMAMVVEALAAAGSAVVETPVDVAVSAPVSTMADAAVKEAPPASLLRWFQAGLRGEANSAAPPPDASLQCHSCAGARRQVEVLHAQLRALFDADPTLEPRHVGVLTPRMETFGPLVEAVFGARRDRADGFPFTTADHARGDGDVAEALASLLELACGRVEADEVIAALTLPPVAARMGLDGRSLEALGRMVQASGVTWGVDERHRAALGRPGSGRGSWRWALDRMMLGAAVPDEETGLLGADAAALAAAAGAGSHSATMVAVAGAVAPAPGGALHRGVLTALAAFVDALGGFAMGLGDTLPLADPQEEDWISRVVALLDRTLADQDRFAAGAAQARRSLAALRQAAVDAVFHGPAAQVGGRAAVRTILERLVAEHPGRGFLASGVTVAALQPMRSVPFRVVALLGMDDGIFPRGGQAGGRDLVAASAPQPGDRDGRLDDRQVFLESVQAAGDTLLLLWSGQDPATGLADAPSVVVEELIETVKELGGPARDTLVVEHPVQAFSDRYREPATKPGIFTYDPLPPRDGPQAPGSSMRLKRAAGGAAPDAEPRLEVQTLGRFWRSPVQAFLKAAGAGRGPWREESDEDDPWELGKKATERLLRSLHAGIPPAVAAATGMVPPAEAGAMVLEQAEADNAARRAARVTWLQRTGATGAPETLAAAGPVTPWEVVLPGPAGVTLVAEAELVAGVGPVIECARDLKGDRTTALAGWWLHLAACAAGLVPSATLLLGRGDLLKSESVHVFAPVAAREAIERLGRAVELRRRGLAAPLPFVAKLGMELAHHMHKEEAEPLELALVRVRRSAAAEMVERKDDAWRVFDVASLLDPRASPSFVELALEVAVPAEVCRRSGLDLAKALKKAGAAKAAGATGTPSAGRRKRRGP